MKFKDIDSEVDEAQDRDDQGHNSPYDNYLDYDLSNDPMIASDERPKSRKERRQMADKQRHREHMTRDREAMKAEILAELRAESGGADVGETKNKEGKRGRKNSSRKVVEQAKDKRERGKNSRFPEYLMSLLSGNILSREEVRRVYPYMLFMAFLAFLYIVNVFDMQRLHRKREELSIEVKELRARSMITTSYRIQATRQSNIMVEIERRGIPLRESLAPNKVIAK